MNNIVKYNDLMAFHPGYYIAEIIEDMEITQTEFAFRLGTTGKTISNLVNGQIKLSNELAKKLSTMLGNSIDFWLNIQKAFDEKVLEIERQKELDEQLEIVSYIDYTFFVRVAKLAATKIQTEQVINLCQFFMISDLRILTKPDFMANFRTGIKDIEKKNIINAQAWLQTALNFAKQIPTSPFDDVRLKNYLPEIRGMTLQEPNQFYPRLKDIFSECGVAFVILPHLKNSGINGVVKWVNESRVVLAMNNRRLNADTFWFSLFHEIKHVLQQKTKTVFFNPAIHEMVDINERLEKEADSFAADILIPPKDYKRFAPSKYTSDAQIIAFADRIGIHPGVVVGRLQHDEIIPQNRCYKLRKKYSL